MDNLLYKGTIVLDIMEIAGEQLGVVDGVTSVLVTSEH